MGLSKFFTVIVLSCSFWGLQAQMWVDGQLQYGNEWINYEGEYLKMKVVSEGMYRVTYADLQAAGWGQVQGSELQLFAQGKERALYVSSSDNWEDGDYLLFYGKGQGSDLDIHLFENGLADMLNPGYSLVTDTAAYFLTRQLSSTNKRYSLLQNQPNISPTPEPYFWTETVERLHNSFVKRPNGVGSMSRFSNGEGFASSPVVNRTTILATAHVYRQGPPASLEIRMASNNSRDHELVYTFNGNQIDRKTFSNFQFLSDLYIIDATTLQASNTFAHERLGAAENRYQPALYSLRYPRLFVWGGAGQQKLEIGGSGAKVFHWEDYREGEAWLFDVTHERMIRAESEEDGLRMGLIQPDSSRYFLCRSNAFAQVLSMERLTFSNPLSQPGTYIMLYHPDIRIDNSGADVLDEYIQYRRSSGHEVLPVNVLDLYDQFAWGADRHFIALRNFAHYARAQRADVDHLFIVGKGREFRNLRSPEQVQSAQGAFFIPTFGAPGADQLLVCSNHSVSPIMAVGRIPVQNGAELKLYLNKVRSYENTQSFPIAEEDRKWMKRVLHLSGGNSAAEQEQLRQIMVRTGRVLENGRLQKAITAFTKLSTEPVEDNVPVQIYDLINAGVSMISFMGHSGSTTIDFNIENFSRYNNKEKYFPFLALGCSVGNIHINGISLGERFVFQEEKAAIAFLASSGLGYPSILENYANRIYDYTARDQVQSIGAIFKDVHQSFSTTGNRFFQEQLEQMTINGDPALRYNVPEGPDVAVDAGSIRLLDGNVNVSQDSFAFSLDILNLGSRVEDTLSVAVYRSLPDGQTDTIYIQHLQRRFRETIAVTLPVRGELATGNNFIQIELNDNRAISEKPEGDAYANNSLPGAGYRFFVFGVSASPLWPPKYAVIQDPQLELQAFTGNLLAEEAGYVWEIDTLSSFDSPFKQRHQMRSKGGILHWRPSVALQDRTTYYWRISGDSISPEAPFNWEESSFSIAQPESAGLSMRHKGQFAALNNPTLRMDSQLGWAFGQVNRTLEIKNQLFLNNSNPSGSIEGFQYGSMFPWNVTHQGVLVQVLDPITGISWRNPPGGRYGSLNTTPSTNMFAFPYDTREAVQRKSLMDFLADSIPNGSIVYVYSIQRTAQSTYAPEDWAADSLAYNGQNLFNVLEAQGASAIRTLEERGSVPFILGFVKGAALFEEKIAENITDVIDAVFTYLERIPSGSVQWNLPDYFVEVEKAYWDITAGAFPASDSVRMQFTLQDALNGEVQSFSSPNQNQGEFNLAPHNQPQNIHFNWLADNNSRFAPQLKNWTVSGAFLPDLILQREATSLLRDTVQQGEKYTFQLEVRNVSSTTMDSTAILYRLRTQQQLIVEGLIPLDSFLGNEKRLIQIELPTQNWSGQGFLELNINPDRTERELRYDNNFANHSFFVQGDQINPLVDVFFDGRSIMNGDLISARPEVHIQLRDDNPYFPLNDTSLFSLRLRRPNGTWYLLSFNTDAMQFIPAQIGDAANKAEVIWRPELNDDGEYTLEVAGRDASGNFSGHQPWQISFRVINRQMISSLVNYPNPFSTATQFVYTLTGSQSPDFYKIQIYTLSGLLVKELTHLELGPLRVGSHVTDYVWDGTDQYGQLLANGVYLYRLQTRNQGEEQVEHFESRLDQFNTNGWSKLVILR